MVDGFGPYYLDKRKELHIFMTVLIPLDEKVIISWTCPKFPKQKPHLSYREMGVFDSQSMAASLPSFA
jgi:hypothetical protein